MNEEQRLVQKRLRVLEHAQKTGNVRKTCRYFGIGRSSFYRWKSAFNREGEAGLGHGKDTASVIFACEKVHAQGKRHLR